MNSGLKMDTDKPATIRIKQLWVGTLGTPWDLERIGSPACLLVPSVINPYTYIPLAKKNKQERLDEKTIALEETQERLHAEQRSYDRKLTSITSEYERNLNGLINHTGMSGLLQAAIQRTEEGVGVAAATSTATPVTSDAGAGNDHTAAVAADGGSAAGAELVSGDRVRGGASGGGGDTMQDAMAKVLHERWLSEREKARTLEARLSDAEARLSLIHI